MIITDHDPVMRRALEMVMADTFHRLCQWHIAHKMGDDWKSVPKQECNDEDP